MSQNEKKLCVCVRERERARKYERREEALERDMRECEWVRVYERERESKPKRREGERDIVLQLQQILQMLSSA